MQPVECMRPSWATIEEGGLFIPWPEFNHPYDQIHSVGFPDGSVFDTSLVGNPMAFNNHCGGWRRWSPTFVRWDLLERMGFGA